MRSKSLLLLSEAFKVQRTVSEDVTADGPEWQNARQMNSVAIVSANDHYRDVIATAHSAQPVLVERNFNN